MKLKKTYNKSKSQVISAVKNMLKELKLMLKIYLSLRKQLAKTLKTIHLDCKHFLKNFNKYSLILSMWKYLKIKWLQKILLKNQKLQLLLHKHKAI